MDCKKFNASRSAGGWVIPRFHLVSRYSGQITWKGRCLLLGLCTLRGGGREVRRVCLPYLFHPFRASTETSPMGTHPSWRPRSVRVRSSRPFCVQLGASLEIMLREHSSQPRPTLNGQDATRKIRKASSRNSLTSQVQAGAAGTAWNVLNCK